MIAFCQSVFIKDYDDDDGDVKFCSLTHF